MKRAYLLYAFILLTLVVSGAGVAEAATIKGKVAFEGTPPPLATLQSGSDPACASLHPQGIQSEEVVVNSNGTLKNVFVWVKEGVTGNFTSPKEPVVFDQKGCQYIPHVVGIQTGQPFQIMNSDNTLHNVHAMPTKNPQFNLGMPLQGMKLTKTFPNAEVMVKVKCDVHGWMNAYVGVVPHPFYKVSGDEGTFEIKDLPPGSYVIESWHEKFGAQTQSVTIGAADEVKELDFSYKG